MIKPILNFEDFFEFDRQVSEGLKTATDADLKITITNPIFIYNEELNFLHVCNNKYLNKFLTQGFKVITEEEAKSMPQYSNISNLL